MAFSSIQPARQRLADEVYSQLWDAIMRRDIGTEDVLVQEKVAAEMEISRTPVREALLRLEQEGVLEASNRGSYRLYQMDDQEVRELYQSRTVIEGQCARILAERQDPFDIAALKDVIAREQDIEEDTPHGYFEAHRHIHRCFVERTRNRFLLEMFDMVWGKAMAFHQFSSLQITDLGGSLRSHMSLVENIERGDEARALEATARHIQAEYDHQVEMQAMVPA